MTDKEEALKAFGELLDIMNDLRAKCPWDKKQTIETLRYLTIEETYELSESILEKNFTALKKELGDLLLHLVFYAKIASETDEFTITDVIRDINKKLIFRHPHIYGEVKAASAKEVSDNWEKIKLKEGNRSVLGGVPVSLPPLVKAYRIQEKASGVGFDWEHPKQVWQKVVEELNELRQETDTNGSIEKMENEFGDLLFALVNYARFIKVNPEDALEKTNKKFIYRFQYLEKEAKKEGRSLFDLSLEEMDRYWNEAKESEK